MYFIIEEVLDVLRELMIKTSLIIALRNNLKLKRNYSKIK